MRLRVMRKEGGNTAAGILRHCLLSEKSGPSPLISHLQLFQPRFGRNMPPVKGKFTSSSFPLLPSAMGTRFCSKWGPIFECDGDLMATFASTNGDPKCNFLKIYLNELIPWNTDEKTHASIWIFKYKTQFHWQAGMRLIKTSFLITSIHLIKKFFGWHLSEGKDVVWNETQF